MRWMVMGIMVGMMMCAAMAPVHAEMKEVKSTVHRIWAYPKAKGNRIDAQFTEKTGCGETGKPEPNGKSIWLKYENPETKYMMGMLLYAKLTGRKVHVWVDTDTCQIKTLSPMN